MPTELELIALETEFDLYLSFTKRLVLNLPDSEDRTRAAIWLQKLRSVNTDDQKKLRNEHLKLLLFALHRRCMLGVFEKPPGEELESFHDGLTLLEMTRELIELTEKQLGSGDNANESPLPPVSTNVSADLKEYCASQSIPKFGAHVYYAVSSEPIQMWAKSTNCVYPAQSDVPNPLQWELTLSKLTDHVLEKQAEAERLAAEAAKDDKTEEKEDTQVLPMIDVSACPEQLPFKWKPDSILTLHQNYDFSDVGVAEDLEVQGKFQLELDEMAFGILDHSLPGRQRVVVRDPYYKDLPADLAERRHHGVIDEAEVESTSSDDDSSDDNKNNKLGTSNSPPLSNNQKSSNKKISAMSAKKYPVIYENAGPIAQKYLSVGKNFSYGIHFDDEAGAFKLGPIPVQIEGDDIVLDINGEVIRYEGTEGVWRLLTQDTSYFKEDVFYTDEDWITYMVIMMKANEEVIKNITMEIGDPMMQNDNNGDIQAFSTGAVGGGEMNDGIKIDYEDRNKKKQSRCCCGKIKKKNKCSRKVKKQKDEVTGIQTFFFDFNKIVEQVKKPIKIPGFDLDINFINSIPGINNFSYISWFQSSDCIYVKELDGKIREFTVINNIVSDSEADLIYRRVRLAVSIIECIIAIIGKNGGWERLIIWWLFNEQVLRLSEIGDYVLDDLDKEIHIIGTQFCGPGTRTRERLAEGQTGLHPIDTACIQHDLYYLIHQGKDERLKADLQLGLTALKRLISLNAGFLERIAAVIVVTGMLLKNILQWALEFMKLYLNA